MGLLEKTATQKSRNVGLKFRPKKPPFSFFDTVRYPAWQLPEKCLLKQ
jgi:hypothetical protein